MNVISVSIFVGALTSLTVVGAGLALYNLFLARRAAVAEKREAHLEPREVASSVAAFAGLVLTAWLLNVERPGHWIGFLAGAFVTCGALVFAQLRETSRVQRRRSSEADGPGA